MEFSKIVAEYDLYFSPGALSPDSGESLCLMRFPSMRSQLDNDPTDIGIKFKPKGKRCQLEIIADTSSSSFSMDTAKTLAQKCIPSTFEVDHANKQFYSSTTVKVDDKQLMVGKMTGDGRILLCQVGYIFNMRPDFTHFDKKDEIDIKEELKAVTMKFAAPEKAGFPARNSNVDESLFEEFSRFKFHAINSREASIQRANFTPAVGGTIKVEPPSFDQWPQSSTQMDVKPKIEELNIGEASPMKTTKHQDLKQATARIKECLIRAKVVSFEEICQYIRKFTSCHFTNDQILPTVESLAVLVQGNWVVKSEILYEDSNDPKSPSLTDITGVPVCHLALARDYLLWWFCQEKKVSRAALKDRLKIPDYDILELLKQLAVFNANDKMWHFRLTTDDQFMNRNPDLVLRQRSLWKVRKSNKLGSFFT